VTPSTTPGTHTGAHGAHASTEPQVYGLLAEFETGDAMAAAARKATEAGYTRFDCYSPYPVPDAADAMNFPKSEMGPVMFLGGLTGACTGFFMQYYLNAYGYSLNVGGRPYLSWPSFIPITFEMMVLTTALTGLFALIALCGLPRYHHPLFGSKTFDRASRDRFFLCIEAIDPKYHEPDGPAKVRAFLDGLHPLSVEEVPE
jgi:hypothetical protein